jgi:hypothetical protein
MEAVQRLRAKAEAAGNLKSNEQQTVTVEAASHAETSRGRRGRGAKWEAEDA